MIFAVSNDSNFSMESLLEQPNQTHLLRGFTRHFGIVPDGSRHGMLTRVIRAFAQLPYENLTKIVKSAQTGADACLRRGPSEVIRDHQQSGTGGTCFSLTATLLQLLRALGYRAEPILADRRYGPDTHCALLVWVDGEAQLVDPGYLIVTPVPLPRLDCRHVVTEFNEIVLTPRDGGSLVDLATRQQGRATYRLTYKTAPVDTGQFLRAWDASFAWDMMRYPLLTRVARHRQLYLHGTRLQIRDRQEVQRSNLMIDRLPSVVAADFGISPKVVIAALDVLRKRGELHT